MQICDALGVGRGITSVIGAGGKSTLLQVLVQELSGSRVLTTTTRMLPIAGIELLLDPSEEALRHALAARGAVCVGSPTSEAFGGVTKLAAPGLPLQTIAGLADHVLVEADGSRRLPLKAHADHEPVVPDGSQRTILILGASGLGRPAGEVVHRAGPFCALAHCGEKDMATPQRVARALAAERAVGRARADVIVVNQVDDAHGERATLARELAAELRALGDQTPLYAGSILHRRLERL
ncbi:selenium cofactor biosynthesis protein YqeC [Parafannyhessea umbonata]|uniref:Probable selenium-dependent hydroxylase accessory protein YqeC n=1 Tax=Parafannyhessea umbonata TaxID=604330 RepID=A0A1H9QRY9_9ACTN|nr:selenium cofactor biosynthesis protein YqeC [Parafannyhessea umbonata]SER63200.1 probable selenium-dependent hydroxylase accessory protein YqeC [Parafannyhessea umbonata]